VGKSASISTYSGTNHRSRVSVRSGWFRIHGKPYLLTPEEGQRQIRVGRERRGSLNPRGQDDEGSPSTRPKQSPSSSLATMQLPFQMMPGQVGAKCPVQLHFLLCRADRRYIGQRRTRDRKGGRRGALLFTNLHQRMGFKHRRRS
ncbi:hypothetical protein Gotur_025048, partial [Gossypium turneri]